MATKREVGGSLQQVNGPKEPFPINECEGKKRLAEICSTIKQQMLLKSTNRIDFFATEWSTHARREREKRKYHI